MENQRAVETLGVEVLVPVALFTMCALIVWAVCAYRFKTRKAVTNVLEAMTQKGETITPEIIHALGIQPRKPHADLRTGVILIALGIAFLILGIAMGQSDKEAFAAFSGIAMFPILIGAAYVGLWVFVGRKETHLGRQAPPFE